MKKVSLLFSKMRIGLLFLAMGLSSTSVFGLTYTATTSGNWSAGTTWGGTAPSFNLTTDQVIIPSGITVTMDNNVTVTGATASVAVQGTLSSSSSQSLTVGALGTVAGAGTINIGSMVLQTASVVTFTGYATVDTFTTALASLQLDLWLTVSQALNLTAGTLTVTGSNSSLTMNAGSTIILSGGALVNSGGTLSLTSSYNVMYTSGSVTTGAEITGAGLNNVTVNVSGGNSVTLGSALTVNGTLSLTSGSLVLNGNNLTLAGTIATTGSGTITSTSSSNITLNTTGSGNGTLNFASGSSVNNLTVNAGAGNTVSIGGSSIAVNGTLTLTSGKLNVGNDSINIVSSGWISGGSSSSYIIASGSGALGMQLTAGASDSTIFPVGTSINFAPVALKLNAGSTGGNVYVTADTGVWAQGTSGVDLSLTQPMVNTSWMIEPSFSGSVNMNIQLMWSAAMQTSGFNHDSAYISHFINGAWNTSAVSSATLTGSAMYALQVSGVTSFSPFAVFGSDATTGIAQINDNNDFEIYPNPATENLIIKNTNSTDNVYLDIIDITGKVVARYKLTDYTTSVSLTALSEGNYLARLYNENMNVVKKFIKL